MLTASGALWGFRRTLPHMGGIAVGFPVMILAVALGLGEILQSQPWLQSAMRWGGAAYLLWLAWHIATARPDAANPGATGARPMSFLQAALFQWVNPKAWVVAAGGAVTYLTAQDSGRHVQALILAAIFLVIGIGASVLWTGVGVGAARLLRSPGALRRFNLALAVLLAASLVPLLAG